MKLNIIYIIMEIEEGVIRRGRRPRRIKPSEISIILYMIRKPNSIIVLLFIQNTSWFKDIAKPCFPSIDVKFILDSARLGLFSSANILQIADVALRVVFLLFLPCFQLLFRLVITLEISEFFRHFCSHNQNNSTSSPGLVG